MSTSSLRPFYDATLNDSDKSFEVPIDRGRPMKLCCGRCELVSTATVGNRQFNLLITDPSGNTIWSVNANGTQAASLTRQYILRQGEAVPAAAVGTEFVIPIPFDLVLQPGSTLRVRDSAAIDAAADDLTVSLHLVEI